MQLVALQPAHEKIGVVDAQWIRHRVVPSLNSSVCALCFKLLYLSRISKLFDCSDITIQPCRAVILFGKKSPNFVYVICCVIPCLPSSHTSGMVRQICCELVYHRIIFLLLILEFPKLLVISGCWGSYVAEMVTTDVGMFPCFANFLCKIGLACLFPVPSFLFSF
jgi:hypothetical protein